MSISCSNWPVVLFGFFTDLRQGREVNETRAHSLQRHSAKRWLASTTKPPAWTVCPRRSGYPQLVAVSRSPLAREPSFDRMRRPKNLQLPCWLWRPKPSWLINCFESRCIFLSFCDVITLTIRELLAVAAVNFVLPKYCQHWRTVLSPVSVAPPFLPSFPSTNLYEHAYAIVHAFLLVSCDVRVIIFSW